MVQRELKPIRRNDAWSRLLQKRVSEIYHDLLYAPLFEIIDDRETQNAKETPLVAALKSGRVRFIDGVFKGTFTAQISRELKSYGGVFDVKAKGYRVARLPVEIQRAAAQAENRISKLVGLLRSKISDTANRVTATLAKLDFDDEAEWTEARLDGEFAETVVRAIGIKPAIEPDMRAKLRADYTETTKKAIKDFSQAETEKLRDVVEEFVTKGVSRVTLREEIAARLKCSKDRAKFVARQETSLFMSKLLEAQYQNAGIDKYRWQAIGGTDGDGRTRRAHCDAHDHEYYWDHKLNHDPVRNTKGQPVHPGEDFGCRCQAVPIVEF